MGTVRDYMIAVPNDQLEYLHSKLELTRLSTEVSNATAWQRGTPLREIESLLHYWKTNFDWRKAEASLNRMPRRIITVEVDNFGTFEVHAIHATSTAAKAIPLLFLHGWPGSSIEAMKIATELTQTRDEISFHVVAPDLINFGFSEGCSEIGFGPAQHAQAYHRIMIALGYNRYVVQGGDVGYALARLMVQLFPEACKAHHINMIPAQKPKQSTQPDLYREAQSYQPSQEETAALQRTSNFMQTGLGYAIMQSTRPQTLSYGLADSPVALLAWIYEKLHDWSDSYQWSHDEVLTWVSIYWFSRAGPGASTAWYYESSHVTPQVFETAAQYCTVPLGISSFPYDITHTPRSWWPTLGPIVFSRIHSKGGHFAAWECPEELCADLREMFGKGGGAHGCVKT